MNGLKLPALNFKVSEDSTNALKNFKKKMMDFWNWISPLVESIKNLFKGLSESFKRLFDDLNENGTFKMVVGWFTEWKDNLTNFFQYYISKQRTNGYFEKLHNRYRRSFCNLQYSVKNIFFNWRNHPK